MRTWENHDRIEPAARLDSEMKQFMHGFSSKNFAMAEVVLHSLVPFQVADCLTAIHLSQKSPAAHYVIARGLLGSFEASGVSVITSFEIPIHHADLSEFVNERRNMFTGTYLLLQYFPPFRCDRRHGVGGIFSRRLR